MVEHTYAEVVGLMPAGCWAFFSSFYPSVGFLKMFGCPSWGKTSIMLTCLAKTSFKYQIGNMIGEKIITRLGLIELGGFEANGTNLSYDVTPIEPFLRLHMS